MKVRIVTLKSNSHQFSVCFNTNVTKLGSFVFFIGLNTMCYKIIKISKIVEIEDFIVNNFNNFYPINDKNYRVEIFPDDIYSNNYIDLFSNNNCIDKFPNNICNNYIDKIPNNICNNYIDTFSNNVCDNYTETFSDNICNNYTETFSNNLPKEKKNILNTELSTPRPTKFDYVPILNEYSSDKNWLKFVKNNYKEVKMENCYADENEIRAILYILWCEC